MTKPKFYKSLKSLFILIFISITIFFSYPRQTNAADIFFQIKEFIERPIIRAIANLLSAVIGNKITSSIVGGQNPLIISDWSQEILKSQSRGNDIFRTILANTDLCPYLNNDVKSIFLADKYPKYKATGSGSPPAPLKGTGESCNKNSECTSGNCNAFTCAIDAGDKKGVFETCKSNSECKTDNCNIGICAYSSDNSNGNTSGGGSQSALGTTSGFVNTFFPAGTVPFNALTRCTLPKNFNIDVFRNDFTRGGGFATWNTLINNPQNNFVGMMSLAQSEQSRQLALHTAAGAMELQSGGGFKPTRDTSNSLSSSNLGGLTPAPAPLKGTGESCNKNSECTSGNCNAFTCAIDAGDKKGVFETCKSNSECKTDNCSLYRCAYPEKKGTLDSCSSNDECQTGFCSPISHQCSYNDTGSGPQDYTGDGCSAQDRAFGRCIKLGNISTPAGLISQIAGGSVLSSVTRLIEAREWVDLVASLINIVADQIKNYKKGGKAPETLNVVANGNQYIQQNPGYGIGEANSNGTSEYGNLNACLSACNTTVTNSCAGVTDADKLAQCQSSKRLDCYAQCNATTTESSQKRRLGDSCGQDLNICSNNYATGITPISCSATLGLCTQCDSDAQCGSGKTCDKSVKTASGIPVGVCVSADGNDLKDSCMNDSQCKAGLFCNVNKKCRSPKDIPGAITSPSPTATASSSATFTKPVINSFNNIQTITVNTTDATSSNNVLSLDVSNAPINSSGTFEIRKNGQLQSTITVTSDASGNVPARDLTFSFDGNDVGSWQANVKFGDLSADPFNFTVKLP